MVLGLSQLVSLVSRGARFGIVAIAAVAIFALMLPSITTLETWNTHNYRYFLPLFPILILLTVVGINSLAVTEPVRMFGAPVYGGLIGFALMFSLVALPTWAVKTGQESAEIREQQISIGYWIRDNLPPGAKVAINDVGAMRYYGERPVLDLMGLVTNGFAESERNGVGSIYEALERMDLEQRPDHFVIYPDWFEGLEDSGILGREIRRFALLREPIIAGGREVVAYEADWSLAHRGDLPQGVCQYRIKDSLDVADLESEQNHDYSMRLTRIGVQPESALEKLTYPEGGEEVVDGGRKMIGGEAFTAGNLTPDRPLTIVMRTAIAELPDDEFAATEGALSLQVLVNGEPAGEWRFEPEGEGWQEPSFTIPADLIQSETVRIELAPLGSYHAPVRPYAPFGYWFIQ